MKSFRTTHRIMKFQSEKVIQLSFSFLNVSTFFSEEENQFPTWEMVFQSEGKFLTGKLGFCPSVRKADSVQVLHCSVLGGPVHSPVN